MSQSRIFPAASAKSSGAASPARHPFAKGSVGEMPGKVPASLEKGGSQKNGLTQKIVGGALLALGVAYLATRQKHQHPTAPAATLAELLYFVNDRIAGYQRAVDDSHDAELRGYYKQLVSQSQQFATDLNTYLTQEGGQRQTSTTLKGKIYRAWLAAQAALVGRDEKTILGANIFGEEWALKAYKDALADHTLPSTMRPAVERQYALSQKTYARLQKLAEKPA